MTTPPPDFDLDAFDQWIADNLGFDTDDDNPRWKSVVVPEKHAAIGNARPVRLINLLVTNEFAHDLYQEAAKRGLNRSSFMRLCLVDAMHRITGRDRDEILGHMPPRAATTDLYRLP